MWVGEIYPPQLWQTPIVIRVRSTEVSLKNLRISGEGPGLTQVRPGPSFFVVLLYLLSFRYQVIDNVRFGQR